MNVPDEFQVPFVVVRVEPSVQDPDTTGAVVLIAVSAGTIAVGKEGAVYL